MKLSIMETLAEAASFYKRNFRYLLGFSGIYVAIEAYWAAQEIILDSFMAQPTSYELIIRVGSWLLLMAGAFVTILIFGPRFLLAIIVQIDSLMKKEVTTLEHSYKET